MSLFQVGDEAELGPVLMNQFLSEAVKQGAKVVLKGNKAVVVEVRQTAPVEAPVKNEQEPEPSAEPAPKKTASRKKVSTSQETKVSRDADPDTATVPVSSTGDAA